jgi:hypothetical protein
MKTVANPLTSKSKVAARLRYDQSMVDADIEGLARLPEIDTLIAEWDRQGIDDEEQIRRLKSLFAARNPEAHAAE